MVMALEETVAGLMMTLLVSAVILLVSASCHPYQVIGQHDAIGLGPRLERGSVPDRAADDHHARAEPIASFASLSSEFRHRIDAGHVEFAPHDPLPLALDPVATEAHRYRYDYALDLDCIGAPCHGHRLTGTADLVIDLDARLIRLEGIDVMSADHRLHLHGALTSRIDIAVLSDLEAVLTSTDSIIPMAMEASFIINALDLKRMDDAPGLIEFQLQDERETVFLRGSGNPVASDQLQ